VFNLSASDPVIKAHLGQAGCCEALNAVLMQLGGSKASVAEQVHRTLQSPSPV
jgi:hypothetical protein